MEKSQLIRPLVIARHMKIPTYVMFDADSDKQDDPNTQGRHAKDNSALLSLLEQDASLPFPNGNRIEGGFTMWHSDIGTAVMDEIGKDTWQSFRAEADSIYGHTGGLRKNSLHIGASLAIAWEANVRLDCLTRVCDQLLNPTSYFYEGTSGEGFSEPVSD